MANITPHAPSSAIQRRAASLAGHASTSGRQHRSDSVDKTAGIHKIRRLGHHQEAARPATCRSALVEADTQPAIEPTGQASPVDSVRLDSEAGVSYDQLQQHLREQDFQRADDETRSKLIQLAGKDAVKRGWVYFSEVQFVPAQDLQTIDALWRAASDNLFGYSVQREVWVQNRRYWTRLFKEISWVTGERNNYRKWPGEFVYDLTAPKGHLPLTNCLRGSQLFEAIMEHPAFQKEDTKPPPSNGSSAYSGLF